MPFNNILKIEPLGFKTNSVSAQKKNVPLPKRSGNILFLS